MFSIRNESRKLKVAVTIILLAFFLTCILSSLIYDKKLLLGSFDKFDNDDVKYVRSAYTLLQTGKFTYNDPNKESVYIMPGIVTVLLPFVKVFGMQGAVMPFRILGALLQTFSMYMIFLITRKIFGKGTALIALLISAIYIPNIYVTTLVLTETIFMFFFMLLVLFTIHAVEEKQMKYYIIGGALWAVCALFRPAIAAFPALIFVMWLVKRYTIKEMLKYASITILVFVLVMSPWWLRNYVTFNQFIPFTLSTGNPSLQGVFINDKVDFDLINKIKPAGLNYGNDEITNNYVEKTFAKLVFDYNLKHDTWNYLNWLTIGKTVNNFLPPFLCIDLFGIKYKVVMGFHIAILLVAFLGLLLMAFKRRLNGWGLFCFLIPVYYDLVHLPFLPFSRYLYPAIPFIIMCCAYFLYVILGRCVNVYRLKYISYNPSVH
jgi:4-amino-4-deoxy-L-arabinose transferase-like glycosyltransferase